MIPECNLKNIALECCLFRSAFGDGNCLQMVGLEDLAIFLK